MATRRAVSADRASQRQRALQRWETEGGAGAGAGPIPAKGSVSEAVAGTPPLGNAELVQMQMRVIALENLVIALLAQATDSQLELVREMAAHISPRPGFTPHPLTIGAAGEMVSLVDRSSHVRVNAAPDD